MVVNPAFTTTISANTPYYRITAVSFRTANTTHHRKVVDGQGAKKNPIGGRYNYPGAITIYLTDTIETCLAEKMFYFQRGVIQSLDILHITGPAVVPPFVQKFVFWEVLFKQDITQVCDLSVHATGFHVMPSLMRNPSQDYWHLKQRRADIEALGYSGIKAPSSRSTSGGHVVALFADQSKNFQGIQPFEAEFRLLRQPPPPGPFINQTTEMLDFFAGEVQITGAPSGNTNYNTFAKVPFHH
jgi:hypothetical protein